MTQEEKDLLLKDLCARLPYGVKLRKYCSLNNYVNNCGETTDDTLDAKLLCAIFERQYLGFRPYLRPMSSMTEEEERELRILWNEDLIGERRPFYIYPCYTKTLDFYNSHHFDYRGLIEKGLALEAKEGMYKTE